MKLPQYDNRPGPGQPLYRDQGDGWAGAVIPLLLIGLPILFLLFSGLTISELFSLIGRLFD